MNFPLVDKITVAEEATLLRPTLFITATELTIGIHETEATWMAERNVPGTEKTITVAESVTIRQTGFRQVPCHLGGAA